MAEFKILSLDGGGAWALIQIRTLQRIYGDLTGHQILNKFDLACANSGGSLSLAGLILNWPLSRILQVAKQQPRRRYRPGHATRSIDDPE